MYNVACICGDLDAALLDMQPVKPVGEPVDPSKPVGEVGGAGAKPVGVLSATSCQQLAKLLASPRAAL